MLRYLELKNGHSDDGPAWIAYVTLSKSGQTLYFNGRGLMKLKGRPVARTLGRRLRRYGNRRVVLGLRSEEEWPRSHWAGSGKVLIEAAAVSHYLNTVDANELDTSRFEITESIVQTNIKRLTDLANASG